MHILSAINATSIFSILRFSSMMAVTLSKNSWSSLFKFFRSFSMFFCSLSVSGMEVITPAVFQNVVDAAVQQTGTERFGNKRIGSCGIALFLILKSIFSCKQDDRDVAGTHIFFDMTT